MNDPDLLSDRLDKLSQNAPAPIVAPLHDVRRGKSALRRRRTRGAAGIATTLVTVGIISATVNLSGDPGRPDVDNNPSNSVRPRIEAASSAVSSLCLHESSRLQESLPNRSTSRKAEEPRPEWEHPAVAPQLGAYRQAAASILDRSEAHLDADVTNIQFGCDPQNVRLTSLGTTLGWTTAGGRGMVQLEVVSSEHSEKPQIVIGHDHWIATAEDLPAGVTKAFATDYQGGQAVYVEREDGLTVAVDAVGTWGINVAPGSPQARDLPTIAKLLKVAASDSLTLPND